MASNINDSFYEIEHIDVSKVIRIQANIRGHLVRKRFKCLRDVYLDIVKSLETNKQPCVQWYRLNPCYPGFIKQKKHAVANQCTDSKTKQSPTQRSMSNEQFPVKRDCDCEKKMISVEIQTSVVSGSGAETTQENTEVVRLVESGEPSPRPLVEEDKKLVESGEPSDHPQGEGFERSSADANRATLRGDQLHQDPEKPDQEGGDGELGGEENTGVSDASSLTDVTSLLESQVAESRFKNDEVKDINSSSILDVRKNLAMELLWVQQAINSRKHYLSLKAQME